MAVAAPLENATGTPDLAQQLQKVVAEKAQIEQLAQSYYARSGELAAHLEKERQDRALDQLPLREAIGTVEGQVKLANALGKAAGEHFLNTDARAILDPGPTVPLDVAYSHRIFTLGYANLQHPGLYVFITLLTAMLLTIKPEYAETLLLYRTLATAVACVISFAIPSWLWPFACITVFLVKMKTGSRWATDAVGAILPGAPKYTAILNWMKQYVLHTKFRAKVIASQEDLLFQFDALQFAIACRYCQAG